MRCTPVTQVKGQQIGRRLNDAPREGTKLREVYDLFQAHKGEPVEFYQSRQQPNSLVQLTDFYGLDIRRIQNGSKRTGRKSLYILAGEWFGRVYVDYVAERLEGKAAQ